LDKTLEKSGDHANLHSKRVEVDVLKLISTQKTTQYYSLHKKVNLKLHSKRVEKMAKNSKRVEKMAKRTRKKWEKLKNTPACVQLEKGPTISLRSLLHHHEKVLMGPLLLTMLILLRLAQRTGTLNLQGTIGDKSSRHQN